MNKHAATNNELRELFLAAWELNEETEAGRGPTEPALFWSSRYESISTNSALNKAALRRGPEPEILVITLGRFCRWLPSGFRWASYSSGEQFADAMMRESGRRGELRALIREAKEQAA